MFPFALGLGVAELLVLVGVAKDAPPSPLEPSLAPVDGAAIGVLAGVAFVVLLAWVLLRTPLVRRSGLPDPVAPGAGVAVSLLLCAVAVALFFINPYAALLFAIPLHCWMLAAISRVRRGPRVVLVLVGLLPLLIVAGAYMRELLLDPLEWLWYGFLLVTGAQVGAPTALLFCVVGGLFAATATIALARWRADAPEPEPEKPASPVPPPVLLRPSR